MKIKVLPSNDSSARMASIIVCVSFVAYIFTVVSGLGFDSTSSAEETNSNDEKKTHTNQMHQYTIRN